ncbi:hypothetical protein GCM10025858_29340 [Alicyclobacillus sacchari]|uniref:hypothetical protein n=1 Tax=Alicyclobacillus sacchari TaxID=392010 RepID=UPI0023E91C82|nr:hypothetical protein [Alicyclobacillus sacchari]GMA58431.1 hypothetical protein GCM10025858_29340 [Alicyclobacillus sacchari]
MTNTAYGAVMTVDRLVREGLEFVGLMINIGFETLAESYRIVLPQVLRDPAIDAVIVLFTLLDHRTKRLCELRSRRHSVKSRTIHRRQVCATRMKNLSLRTS